MGKIDNCLAKGVIQEDVAYLQWGRRQNMICKGLCKNSMGKRERKTICLLSLLAQLLNQVLIA